MKKLFVLSFTALSLFLSACSENSTGPAGITSVDESSILKITSGMVDAVSMSADTRPEAEGFGWEVTVTMDNGALVKFHYNSSGEIIEVQGLTGPYDYDVKVGKGLIPYSDARKIALNTVKGDIGFWKFERDESFRSFEYRFNINNERKNEVRINAITGEVIRVK